MIITIAGIPGSGKSTICNILKEKYNYQIVYTGKIIRELAAEKNMSILEFNNWCESDKSADNIVDTKTIEIANNLKDKNVVFDSRMAWHFVPNSLKVYLTLDPKIAAMRVYNQNREDEKYNNIDNTLLAFKNRLISEQKRYLSLYNVDILDKNNYDIIIDSEKNTPEQIIDIILQHNKKKQ